MTNPTRIKKDLTSFTFWFSKDYKGLGSVNLFWQLRHPLDHTVWWSSKLMSICIISKTGCLINYSIENYWIKLYLYASFNRNDTISNRIGFDHLVNMVVNCLQRRRLFGEVIRKWVQMVTKTALPSKNFGHKNRKITIAWAMIAGYISSIFLILILWVINYDEKQQSLMKDITGFNCYQDRSH